MYQDTRTMQLQIMSCQSVTPVSDQYGHRTCAMATILNKIINAPCGTLKLLLALGVAKYIKAYKIHFMLQITVR